MALPNPFWSADEKRARALWRIALQFALRVDLLIGGASLVGAIAVALGDLSDVDWQHVLKHWSPPSLGYSIALIAIEPAAALLSVLVATRFLDRRPFSRFGFHVDRHWWADLAFGLALAAVLVGAIFLAELSLGWVRVTGTFVTPAGGVGFVPLVAIAALRDLGNGFEEELADRAYLLRNGAEGLRWRRVGPALAIMLSCILTSVFFGLGHFDTVSSVVGTGAIGLWMALTYVWTGEIAIAIGLHTTWNLTQSLLGLSASGHESQLSFVAIEQGGPALWTGGDFGPEAGLFCAIACALGVASSAAWIRWTRGAVTIHAELADHRAP